MPTRTNTFGYSTAHGHSQVDEHHNNYEFDYDLVQYRHEYFDDHKFDDHVAQADFKELSATMLPTLAEDPNERAMFEAAIDAISFSKEKKRGTLWWSENLDARWLEWRDVVSDADKLEALGVIGFNRCFEESV